MATYQCLDTDALNARKHLFPVMEIIKKQKPKTSGMKILNPSDDSDWKMIKYYNRMNKKVKDSFRAYMAVKGIIKFIDAGPRGPNDNILGNRWHKLLRDKIQEIWDRNYSLLLSENMSTVSRSSPPPTLLFSLLQFGITVLVNDFPLYGFMCSEDQLQPEPYFWQGDADAIGLFYNEKRGRKEYVIIDWKVKRDLLDFWKSSEAYGMYLHQCLVYAKLFQLHMNLDYLPSILIVPISSDNGKDMCPAHFFDYPDECKKKIHEYRWTTEIPSSQPRIYWYEPLFRMGPCVLDKNVRLIDIIEFDATVGDLMKALSMEGGSLKVIPKKQEDD